MSSWALTSFLNDYEVQGTKSSVGQKVPKGKGMEIKPPIDDDFSAGETLAEPASERKSKTKRVTREKLAPHPG